MQSYWIRIGVGALGVFLFGMVVVTIGRRGSRMVHELAASDGITIPFPVGGFTVDGNRLGSFSKLNIRRTPSDEGRVRALVRLDNPGQTEHLSSCTLVLEDGNFEPGADFRCAAVDESLAAMTRIGEIEFAPGQLIRPLYALHGEDFAPLEEVASAATGPEDFEMAAVIGNGGTVRIRKSGTDTRLVVRDTKGNAVVNLNARRQ